MMKVLSINCGSSTIKYKVFQIGEGGDVRELASGLLDRIGIEGSKLIHRWNGKAITLNISAMDHREGLENILKILTSPDYGVISDLSEVYAVGHRVVHGGDSFFESTLVTEEVLEVIRRWSEMAPLHNPANIAGIEAALSLMPETPQVAVFDTAFHQTIPEEAYLYAIPYELYERYKIRRYGFHGTSHRYVAHKAAEFLGVEISRLKMVTCHLGAGCSITAVCGGRSIDTSMGFTPLEGLVMGTRSGDIDPAIVFYLMRKEKITSVQMNEMLNKKSGLLGLSDISSDMRDILRAMNKDNPRAKLTFEVFIYRLKKYIGAYVAVMNGIDALVLTGGIGENVPLLKQRIETEVSYLLRDAPVLVIPTNEELMIAKESAYVIQKSLDKRGEK